MQPSTAARAGSARPGPGAEAGGHGRAHCSPLVFITSHARVLLALARDPEIRVRELAEAAGVTRRSAYRLLADLVAAGYVRRKRVGRRNRYELDPDQPISDPIAGPHTLGDLIAFAEDEER
jgi:DNA-binding transcriptional ArsR family regulator